MNAATSSTPAGVHRKTLNQQRRARALFRLFWRTVPAELRGHVNLSGGLRDVPQAERSKFAAQAGLSTPPSETTWELFVGLVEDAISDEKRRAFEGAERERVAELAASKPEGHWMRRASA